MTVTRGMTTNPRTITAVVHAVIHAAKKIDPLEAITAYFTGVIKPYISYHGRDASYDGHNINFSTPCIASRAGCCVGRVITG